MLSEEKLIAAKKEIPFDPEPLQRIEWFNLRPEQKLILQAARTNNVDYIRQMGQSHYTSEFNFTDQKGRTPLYVAVENKNIEVIRELVKIGADVNARCVDGNTCLHRMMMCRDRDPRNERIINILLNNGQ